MCEELSARPLCVWDDLTGHAVPGTARSRSFALSSFGETYCSSSSVRVGRFLLIFRNTCEIERVSILQETPTEADLPLPGSTGPTRDSDPQSVRTVGTDGRIRAHRRGRDRRSEQRRSRAAFPDPVIDESVRRFRSVGDTARHPPFRACHVKARASRTWRRCCGRRRTGATPPRVPRARARATGSRRE